MKSLLYLLSGFFFLIFGIVSSLLTFDYGLYEEYKFVYNIALYSIEKDWLMSGMVREQRNILIVNIFKSLFIFLSCAVIMIVLLKKSLKISNEGDDEQCESD